jgi:galactokinase
MSACNKALADCFAEQMGQAPCWLARAPGRVEFIGNHIDYNGGEVLGAAIDRYIHAAAAPRSDRKLRFVSTFAGAIVVEADLGNLRPLSGDAAWANYPLGVLKVMMDAGMQAPHGFDFMFTSDLPVGAGLSSSAAIELATAEVLAAACAFPLAAKDKILLCQRAENTFAGVPCGILDQTVSTHGRQQHLVHIDCATTAVEVVPMPAGLHFWIFNTNQKHSLVDSLYAKRHDECRDALQRLQEADEDLQHLALFDLDRLEALSDDWPKPIRRRARHVVQENLRVRACRAAIIAGDLAEVGRLLYASHESSRENFANSTESLDTMVGLLQGMPGVIGARLSGGGFGGVVMALATDTFTAAAADDVIARYRAALPANPVPGVLKVETADGATLLG